MQIFKLFGSILIDDKEAQDSLSKTDDKTKSLSDKLRGGIGVAAKFGKGLVAGAGVAATAMGGLLVQATNTAGEINKFADVTGMSTKAFQEWDYVAKSFGFSMEAASGDIAMLAERAMDAASGTGESAEMFKQLGIDVMGANGQLKSQKQLFNETITALQGMENVTKRNAIATAMLGTTGEELAPVLNMTSEELKNMKNNANVISEEQLQQAEKFRLGWEQIKNTFSTVITQIGISLMPMFQGLFNWIMENMPMIQNIISIGFQVIKTIIGSVVVVIQTVIAWFQQWFASNQQTVNGIWQVIMTVFTQVKAFIMSIWTTILNFWKTNGQQILQASKNVFNFIKVTVQAVMPMILGIIKNVWSIIQTVFRTAVGVIMGVIKTFSSLLTGDFNGIKSGLMQIWNSLWSGIKGVVSGAWNLLSGAFTGLLGSIKRWFTGLKDDAIEWGKNMINGFIDGIKSMVSKVKNAASGVMDNIKGFLGFNSPAEEGEGRHIVEWGSNMLDGFLDGVKQQIPNAEKLMNNVVKTMKPKEQSNNDFANYPNVLNSENIEALLMELIKAVREGKEFVLNGKVFAKETGEARSEEDGRRVRRVERGLAT